MSSVEYIASNLRAEGVAGTKGLSTKFATKNQDVRKRPQADAFQFGILKR
jgi:hypothetical protein